MEYVSVAVAGLVFFALLTAWGCAVGGEELAPVEACVLPPLALLGSWALAMWALGSAGWLSSASVCASLAATLAGATVWSARLVSRHKPSQSGFQVLASRLRTRTGRLARGARGLDLFEKLSAAFLSLMSGMLFVLTLAPPSGGDYDSLMYHLAAPMRYIDAGRVVELAYDHHTYFPFTFEMLFAAPLALWSDPLKGAVGAKLLHWVMLPASILLLLCAGARWNQRRAGWIAALAWASIPVVATEATTAYIDLGLAAFVLAAFLAFGQMLYAFGGETEGERRSWMWWSAAMGGFALGSKYLGALFVLWLGAWWVVSLFLGKANLRSGVSIPSLRWLLAWSLVASLVGGGWYARNQAWVGSPVFPFAYGLFGGEGWSAERAHKYDEDQKRFGFGREAGDWALLPLRLSLSPFNAAARPDGSILGLPSWPLSSQPDEDRFHTGLFEVAGFAGQTMIGPLLLALGVPALALRDKPRAVGMWAWSVGFLWVFWGATGQYARYLLPALALWCGVCGWGAERLWRGRLTRWALGGVVAAWLPVSLLLAWRNNSPAWPVVSGQVSGREWLKRSFYGFEAMEWANTQASTGATFAVFGEPRCFYLRRPYFWGDVEHNTLLNTAKLTPENAFESLRRLGATHVLWNTGPTSVFGPPPILREALQTRGSLVFEANGYRVYRLG
jgi:hypothetical protein